MRGLLVALVCAGCDFPATQPAMGDDAPRPPDTPPDMPPDMMDPSTRIRPGIVAFWAFEEPSGSVMVPETAASLDPTQTPPVTMAINGNLPDGNKYMWNQGFLELFAATTVTNTTEKRLAAKLRTSATGVTLEVWVNPGVLDQAGTAGAAARIAQISSPNGGARNISIGQDHKKWVGLLRNAGTGNTGMGGQGQPNLEAATDNVAMEVTQLVVTGDPTNGRKLYVNGTMVANDALAGDLLGWDAAYIVSFGAEPTANNPWKGRILMAAMYNRALSDADIQHNFALGANGNP